MKSIKILSIVALVSFVFYGCPSETVDPPAPTTYYDYLPLADLNNWYYNNTIESNGPISPDILEIDGTVSSNNNTYHHFVANNDATGIYTLYMGNLDVRKDNHNYRANGTFTINLGTEAIDIPINDEVMLTEGASVGDVLSTISGTQNQTMNDIPLTIYYNLKVEVVAVDASKTIDGTTYNNTITTKTTLNMKIDATISGFTVNAMAQQDVVILNDTYADQKGMMLSEAKVEYHLEDFSAYGIDLGTPQDYLENSRQVIVNYTLN